MRDLPPYHLCNCVDGFYKNTTHKCRCACSAWCMTVSRRCRHVANKSCVAWQVQKLPNDFGELSNPCYCISQQLTNVRLTEFEQIDRVSFSVFNGQICPARLLPCPLVVDEFGRVAGDRDWWFTVYCRSAVGYLVPQYRGDTLGPLGNKNGPFLGQLVKNNDHICAFRKPFQNFGKIRFFTFQIRGQTVSFPNWLWARIAYVYGPS